MSCLILIKQITLYYKPLDKNVSIKLCFSHIPAAKPGEGFEKIITPKPLHCKGKSIIFAEENNLLTNLTSNN